MSGQLLVLRHLETQDNKERRFCSGDRDVSILSGQKIPQEVIQELQKRPKGYVVAHTGLKRSAQTAVLVSESMGYSLQPSVFPQFRERRGGKLAGLTFLELKQFFPKISSPAELWSVEAPELGLESVQEFFSRIEEGLTHVVGATILVAHAGSIKGIQAVLATKEVEKRRKILCNPTPGHHELFHFRR